MLRPILLALALSMPPCAVPARDPLDAGAAVPPLIYRSTLGNFAARSAARAPAAPGWRQANDEVARIGGWRAYAREAAASEPAASAASAAHHKH